MAPPEFPCKQHGDFKSAAQRRKHVNLLLLDGCDEFERTYGPDGRPRHPLVLPLQPRKPSGPAPVKLSSEAGATHMGARRWTTAYEEGGQEAADVAKQVGSSRTPIGNFFGLVNPGVARQDPTDGLMPNTHCELLCKDALASMGRLRREGARPGDVSPGAEGGGGGCAAAEPTVKACHSGHVGSATSTDAERASRPWLMPHQTQDAAAGARMARAVNSKRTPIGGFAVFDLAKAPK